MGTGQPWEQGPYGPGPFGQESGGQGPGGQGPGGPGVPAPGAPGPDAAGPVPYGYQQVPYGYEQAPSGPESYGAGPYAPYGPAAQGLPEQGPPERGPHEQGPYGPHHPQYPPVGGPGPSGPRRDTGGQWVPPALLAAVALGVGGLLASWSYTPGSGPRPDAFAGPRGFPLVAVLALVAVCALVDLVRRRVWLSPLAGVPALLAVVLGIVLSAQHWSDGAPPLYGRADLLYGLPNATGVLITEGALALVQVVALAALATRRPADPTPDAYGAAPPADRAKPLVAAVAAVVTISVAAAVALTAAVPVGPGAEPVPPGPTPTPRPTTDVPGPPTTAVPDARPLTPVGATATCTAPPGVDSSGARFEYRPEFALDADPTTAWRCDGDGVGQSLRVDLGTTRTVTQIDVVPGFAKTDPYDNSDRYAQCRRLATVRFDLDDGTSLQQTFDTDPGRRDPQTLRLPRVATRYVTMTILTSVPGEAIPAGPPTDKIAVSTLVVSGS